MSGVTARLSGLLGHLSGSSTQASFEHHFNHHALSPTFFLPRAAAIEPNVSFETIQLELSKQAMEVAITGDLGDARANTQKQYHKDI